MAISHTLLFAAAQPINEVAVVLLHDGQEQGIFSSDAPLDHLTDDVLPAQSGCLVRVSEVRRIPGYPPDPILDDLNIAATTSILFRLDGSAPDTQQHDDMVRLTLAVLRRFSGDAVLEYQFELIRLLRRNGHLQLGEDQTFWTATRLEQVTEPYEWVPNPFPGN
jgi:hypothetical protein